MGSEYFELATLRDAGVQLIDCVHKTPPAQDEGVPYITIPNLQEGRVVTEGARRITKEDMLAWNIKCDPTPGDVILSRRCNPGVTAVVPPDFEGSLGQNLVLLRSIEGKLDQAFFRWAARSPQWWNEVERYLNVGAVFDSLRCADIPKFEIPLPPQEEQKAIANILSTLDQKIELNRKTNETLEGIAKALFKSWFVDFDPVKAKAEGRPTGLPDEISELFPDSFDESELGEIPSGWRATTISNLCEVVTKGTTPTSIGGSFSSSGIPFYKVESISESGQIIPGKCAFVSEEVDNMLARSRIHEGDILFSIAGTIGRVALMGKKDIPANTNQALAIVRAKKGIVSPNFLFLYLRDKERIEVARSKTVQSVQSNFSLGELKNLTLVLPDDRSRSFFEDILSPIRRKIFHCYTNSLTLTDLRDALLPRLISGELRVPDAEKMLEEVGI